MNEQRHKATEERMGRSDDNDTNGSLCGRELDGKSRIDEEVSTSSSLLKENNVNVVEKKKRKKRKKPASTRTNGAIKNTF